MNEEEKKAIEFMKKLNNMFLNWNGMEETDYTKNNQILLNLIEKQQAEIDNKEKIIKAMENEILYGIYKFKNKKQIKEYFEKKAQDKNGERRDNI